ncbi:MAG: cytochrome c-type biogenesis CcmF C-terminal domain-containing protein, partial [Sphingobium sp.]
PLALALMVVLAAGPVTRWRRDSLRAVAVRLAVPLLAGAVALALLVALAGGRIGILPLLGLIAAALVGVASLAPLWGRNLRRTPLFTWGMVIAHLGCAVSVAGMASESAFSTEKLVAARPGETIRTAGWTIAFTGVTPVAGPNWTAMEGRFAASRGGGAPRELKPQARFFAEPPTNTTESALLTRWDGQLYVVLGDPLDDGRWQLRIWWKPFVTLIWAGGGLIGLGGVLAILGRVGRGWLRRRREPKTRFA